ncbi:MAG: hypothetical protein A2W91_20305 [Bacteroidetes bacterium GWF2_38_335]|nr:MAG: hypothetical protein A2W91_20305 [Bacteroidetes bacterium GWF2_38_335]OFY79496.1 MAG: hypothetical protein A2281_13780 [Bacteroidetes bacterium RIFOXYA12_FULL_38_20]HBS86565.1 hypothetical protein [Bacteroidales bacterium]
MRKILIPFIVFLLSFVTQINAQCSYKVQLYDTYGDGWNGGNLTILVNGTPVLTAITLASGSGPLDFPFTVSTGDAITSTYTAGSWAYENGYRVFDSDGVQIFADGGGVAPLASSTIGTASCPACPAPASLNAAAGNVFADLSWVGVGPNFNIEWGPDGFTPGSGTLVSGIAATTYNLTGLTASTNYDFYVQSDCGGTFSSWAGPYSFATLCETVTSFPYLETFDTWPPTCWDLTGGTQTCMQYVGTIKCARANFWSWTSGNYAYMTTPLFDLSSLTAPQFSFDWSHLFNTSYPTDQLEVLVSDDLGATWTQVWNNIGATFESGDGASTTTPGTFVNSDPISLSSFGSTVLIRFRFNSGYGPDCFIDNVLVEQAPSCPKPTNLAVSNITAHTVDVNWVEFASATEWYLEYGAPGFTPGDGTYVYTNTIPFTITGLVPETDYDVYVRAYCTPGDTSAYTGPVSFTTGISCPQPTAFSSTYYDSDEVALEWTSGGAAHWNIEYGPAGFIPGAGTLIVDVVSPYTITGLTPETAYEFYVQDSCGVGDVSSWTGPVSITTTALCAVPTALDAYGITDVQAILDWNGFDATLWDIEYGVSPYTATGTPTIEDVTNPYTLTGLTGETSYDYFVRADCGGGTTSTWTGPFTFTTLMAPLTNPTPCEVGLAILDNVCLDIPINVTGVAGTQLGTDIQLREVKLIIDHTYDGDMSITLESPNGVTTDLSVYSGGGGDDYGVIDGTCSQFTSFVMCAATSVTSGTAPFNGQFIPEGDFATFNDNSNPNGVWVLHVCDDAGGDVGSFHFAELVFGNSGSDADFLTYSLPDQLAAPTIDDVANTIDVTVGFSATITSLIATYTTSTCATVDIGGVPQTSGVTANDFSAPVVYTVYAEDGTPETWTVNVTVAPANTETDILTYSVPGETLPATIDNVNHTVAVNVGWMTNITSLIATFTLSYGADAAIVGTAQTSAVTANDFTNPLIYTITAEDGTTVQDWTITLTQDVAPLGAFCDNPIPLTLPAVAVTGTTDGFGDNYGSDLGGNPCGDSYLNGDDIVYEFTVDGAGTLVGDMTSPDTWIGMMIYDGCPNVAGTNCINAATNSGSSVSFADVAIGPGTYYVIISSWPSPQSIDFTFNLAFTPLPQDLAVVFPDTANYVCSATSTEQVMMYIGNTGGINVPTGDTIYTYYQINGGTIVEDTLILGSDLMPGDSTLFIFDETVDLSATGVYSFMLWFQYDNDDISFNDTLIGTVQNTILSVTIAGGDTITTTTLPYTLFTIGGFASYYWYNADGTDTGVSPIHSADTSGWYYVDVTDANGCTATDSIFIDYVVNINEVDDNMSLSVYPNPSKGEFFVNVNLQKDENLSLIIRNTQGQIILKKEAGKVSDFKQKIDLGAFADGVYYLEVRSDSSFFVEKIVIQ